MRPVLGDRAQSRERGDVEDVLVERLADARGVEIRPARDDDARPCRQGGERFIEPARSEIASQAVPVRLFVYL